MKQWILTWVIVLCLGLLPSCANPAEELYETAKLEEIQHNPEHARKLYEEIIQNYPDTEFAAFAKERLAELTAQPLNPSGYQP